MGFLCLVYTVGLTTYLSNVILLRVFSFVLYRVPEHTVDKVEERFNDIQNLLIELIELIKFIKLFF